MVIAYHHEMNKMPQLRQKDVIKIAGIVKREIAISCRGHCHFIVHTCCLHGLFGSILSTERAENMPSGTQHDKETGGFINSLIGGTCHALARF